MDQSVPGGEGPAAPQPAAASQTPTSATPAPTANEAAQPSPAAGATPARPPTRDEWGFDTSFSPSASAELESYRTSTPPPPICMWCNSALPSRDATRCPTCRAALVPPEGTVDVPGLTSIPGRPASFQPSAPPPPPVKPADGVVSRLLPRSQVPAVPDRRQPDLSPYEGLTPEEIALLADSSVALREEIAKLDPRDAFQPPSRDVRQAMLQIEFEADRADPMRIVDPGPLAERRRDEEPTV
jgi:hypothetical protein